MRLASSDRPSLGLATDDLHSNLMSRDDDDDGGKKHVCLFLTAPASVVPTQRLREHDERNVSGPDRHNQSYNCYR